MRKIVVWEFMTLDGIVEAPEQWVNDYHSPDVADFVKAQNLEPDALLLGRVTYEAFISFWPHQTNNEFGFADKLNQMPKFIVSSTLAKTEWNNSHLIKAAGKAHLVNAITAMKQEPGGSIGLTGSPTLVQFLSEHDLIDEYRLLLHPIVRSSGQRLFKDGSVGNGMKTFKLVDCQPFSSGVVALSYQRDL
jgi:dihydrofolate reductase